MTRRKLARRMSRPARDFLLSLILFCAVATPTMLSQGQIHSAWADSSMQAAFGSPDQQLGLIIVMAIMFAALVTLNVWFVRHLRRAYAPPRNYSNRSGRR